MSTILQYPLNTPAISDTILGTKLPLIDTGDPITSNFSVGDIIALASSISLGYTSYVATFRQELTSDPVATELSNTTGLTFTWTRDSIGVYKIVPSSSMTGGLWWNINGYETEASRVAPKYIAPLEAKFISVNTTTGVNVDEVTDGWVEIRIYT
tara:strand:+ start:52 stop:513 length:462 start_codon:yes stop_codon:yes gene_type:complete